MTVLVLVALAQALVCNDCRTVCIDWRYKA